MLEEEERDRAAFDVREDIEQRQSHPTNGWDWKEHRIWYYGSTKSRLEYIGSQNGWYKAPSLLAEADEGEVVYILHSPEVGRVKIGRTNQLTRRLAVLRTGSPTLLHLVKTYPVESGISEGYLHRKFALQRLHGEWFEDSILDELP